MWSSLRNFFLTAVSMVPFFSPPTPPISTFELIAPSIACSNPTERREWSALSTAERKEWIGAIKCVANMPHNGSVIGTQNPIGNPPIDPQSSYYDDFVYTHLDLLSVIHLTGYFLPWHRNYVYLMETVMKDYCGYKGAMPWWDWTKDTADFYNSPFFKDTDPDSSVGGWGNPTTDMEVQDGSLAGFKLAYPYPHTLRRNYTLKPWVNFDRKLSRLDPDKLANETFTASEYARLTNSYVGDYRGFQTDIERVQGIHLSIHDMVGADLAGLCTVNAPANCNKAEAGYTPNDKLWSEWQSMHAENKHAFSGGSISSESWEEYYEYPVGLPPDLNTAAYLPSNGLFGTVRIQDVLSTTGGYLCYVYV